MNKKQAYANLIEFLRANNSESVLSSFNSGWGGLKELLLPLHDQSQWLDSHKVFYNDVKRVHEVLAERYGGEYQKVLDGLKNSLLTSFYTPIEVIQPTLKLLRENGLNPERILEPSSGTGTIINALREVFPDAAIRAVEKEKITAEILEAKNIHNVEVINKPFEEDHQEKDFDLVVSNIPFGQINVYDAQIYKEANPIKVQSTTRIHNYFFVKGLDKIKENGYLAFITSTGVMDSPSNKKIREYLVKNADLIGAVRLPDHVFNESGTSACSDLIILKKNTKKKKLNSDENAFIENATILLENEKGELKDIVISKYFETYPEKMLGRAVRGGQYGEGDVNIKSKDTLEQIGNKAAEILILNKRFELAPEEITDIKLEASLPEGKEIIPENVPISDKIVNGNLMILNGKAGRYSYEAGLHLFEHIPALRNVNQVANLIYIRNSYRDLLTAEMETLDEKLIESMRAELNTYYDQYNLQYGALHDSPNLINHDVEDFKLFSLENKVGNKYEKAQIFDKRINGLTAELKQADNLHDAVLFSLNTSNKVDIHLISSMLKKSPQEVLENGITEGLLYLDPYTQAGGKVSFKPVTADEFMSGNVVNKYELLQQNQERFPIELMHHYEHHVQKIHDVQPALVPIELIDINIGERWIDQAIYKKFITQLLESEVNFSYLESNDSFSINALSYNAKITDEYCVRYGDYERLLGDKLLEHAFAGTSPNLTMKDDKGNKIPDTDAMRDAEMKMDKIMKAWQTFIFEDLEVREKLETTYNRMFNNTVVRKYNGSHLTLPNLEHFVPRDYQKDAIWMILQRNGGLADHKVGRGKTLIFCAASMEMRRLGIARKPLIIAMKANANAIYKETFLKAYPNASVLCPSEQDFKPENRKKLFAKIMNNDWDSVILTHDQFKLIPQDFNLALQMAEEEKRAIERDLELFESENKGSSRIRAYKDLEKRKASVEANILSMTAEIKKDGDIIHFGRMGFDHLIVDESHIFKNLAYTTRYDRVAGLGNKEGSQRAHNLAMAIIHMQNLHGGDKGVSFFSGTPISNSLVELFIIFKYLRPNSLKELSMNSFDSWAKLYARKTTEYEFGVTGEIKKKERFREFIKVPELQTFYREIAHVVNDHNCPIDEPKVISELISLEPDETQNEFIQNLISFAKTKDGSLIGLGGLTETQKQAYMLLATNMAKKMSLDMRLINPEAEPNLNGKLYTTAKMLFETYTQTKEFKGTQLVFCDMSTPDSQNTSFNAYKELKQILVMEYGVPEREFQFIHSHRTDKAKEALIKQVNKGEVRIMMGSTSMMGTGVNAQERVMAMYHLDIPWRPSDMDQRNGRGGRPGNWWAKKMGNNTVKNYIMATKKSLDSYQFNLLQQKQNFIDQLRMGDVKTRSIDEGSMSEDGSMNFAEYVASLSGNLDLLERVKVQKQVNELEAKYQVFSLNKSQAKHNCSLAANRIDRSSALIDVLLEEKAYVEKHENENPFTHKEETYMYPKPVTIQGSTYYDPKDVGAALHIEMDKTRKNYIHGEKIIGEYCGLSIVIKGGLDPKVAVKSKLRGDLYYMHSNGLLNDNLTYAGKYITNALTKFDKLVESERESIRSSKNQYEVNKRVSLEEWQDSGKLTELKQKLAEINTRLDKANPDLKQKDQESDSSLSPDQSKVVGDLPPSNENAHVEQTIAKKWHVIK